VKQQGSFRAGTRLGQHLRRHRPERQPGVHDSVRQALSGESTALDHCLEAKLFGVGQPSASSVKVLPS
jgi:hypothetical protein